ncbi:MAG: Uma2 family endonuclease [Deltaproteobacteria bacterium]|nr:Uma2 family endonuclease [Deltaproteobacteria bacterium]
MSEPRTIQLRYQVQSRDDWALSEEPMPESQPHDLTVELIRALLSHWIARNARNAQVARNLAVRWDEQHPRVGVDPDVCLIVPATPEGPALESLATWRPGHTPPRVAFEVVSSSPQKDYISAPERYAASGTVELVVFDSMLRGPRAHGGPHRIQVWRRAADGTFERVAAGEGPFFLESLDAWAFATDEGQRLRFADDREGTLWWSTAEEAERAEKVRERAEKVRALADNERERAEKEAALARVAALEAELARR